MVKSIKKPDYYRISFTRLDILGVRVDFILLKKALSLIENWVNTNRKYQITTPNPEQIILSLSDYRFKKILNSSALAVADGAGLLWAAKRLYNLKNNKSDLKEDKKGELQRLGGIDLMLSLCKLASKKRWRVFLLGGKKGSAKKAKLVLKKNFKNLVVFSFEGSLDVENQSKKELKTAINKINKKKPHLLFVAYGAPLQEKWIAENLKNLNVNIVMGVGGSFDYLSGKVKRAPQLLRKKGLEWLWRLSLQPWRLL